jgi:hypothetical protein
MPSLPKLRARDYVINISLARGQPRSEGKPSMCTYPLPYPKPAPDDPNLTRDLSLSLDELPNLLLTSFGLALVGRVFFRRG